MDGFHLAQSRLVELGRQDRKGAIDTFDGAGFLALIRRLRSSDGEIIYAPQFRRDLEEPVAGALPIEPGVGLVVVEGSYLLVPDGPWGELRALLDEVWYCEPDERLRLENLIARHRRYRKSDDEARQWALGPDQRNAELVTATRSLADVIVDLDGQLPGSTLTGE
jgi:pantothenate kinase